MSFVLFLFVSLLTAPGTHVRSETTTTATGQAGEEEEEKCLADLDTATFRDAVNLLRIDRTSRRHLILRLPFESRQLANPIECR
jgi:hypothetical protein